MPGFTTDAKPIYWASRYYYSKLLKAGVRIFEYQETMMHCKHLVIDDQWSIIGSSNLDFRSFYLNKENVLGILNKDFAQSVEKSFVKDLQRTREIKLREWVNRPFWERALERFMYLFEEQF